MEPMRRWLGSMVLLAGCVTSNSVVCPETGLICPSGYQCDLLPSGDERCLEPGQVAACATLQDGEMCTYEQLPGVCTNGACEPYRCGDGLVTMGEQCDGANIDGKHCTDLGFYGPEDPTCDESCKFVTMGCTGGECGDAIVNGPELCDGPTTKSCVSLGFDAGSVRCDLSCGFTIRDCTKFGWTPESLDIVALAVGASTPTDQWAVGLDGRIMQFDGAFWGAVDSGVTNDLKAVWAKSPYAWTVGLPDDSPVAPGVVLFWNGTEAAPSWQPIANPPAATFQDVWAVDPMAVYVATKELGVQRYDGAAWSQLGSLTGEVYEVHGTSPTDIWAATAPGLQHWDGASWTPAALPDTRIRFIDANAPDDVWVAGETKTNIGTGVIAHWNGAEWRIWRTVQEIYNGITSTAPNDAWLVVAGGELRHFDGRAWSSATTIAERPDGTSAVSGFHAIDANHVVAVSTLRTAYRYRGLTFGQYDAIRLHPESNPFNSEINLELWSAAADDVYIVNARGQVLKFDGARWSMMFQIPQGMTTVVSEAIWGFGPDALFVAANSGSVFRWNGTMWIEDMLTPNVALDEVWGSTPTNVWAFGAGGAWRYDGSLWTRHVLSGGEIVDAHGAGTTVYAIELSPPLNKLWRFANGMWSEVATGATTRLTAVNVVDAMNVHVAADNGHLLHFDGAIWRDHVVSAISELRHLASSGPTDVVAASDRELFLFDGVEWSQMRTPVDFVPNTPDYFPIAGLFASPGRIEILLEKWRVRTLLRTRPFICDAREECGDGIDNNCDGFIDTTDVFCQ